MAESVLSLFDVSNQLGVSPSAIKKRVANLNLPVERGPRGKLLFNEQAFALLCRADELLKAGYGFEECRRQLGLDGLEGPAPEFEVEDEDETADEHVSPAAEPEVEAENPAPVAEPVAAKPPIEVLEVVVPAASPEPLEAKAPAAPTSPAAQLPMPVFIQLGRRRPSDTVRLRMTEQPTSTPMPPSQPAEPEAAQPTAPQPQPEPSEAPPVAVPALTSNLMLRLDSALRLIEEKDKQNHTLQSKLLVAYDEMTKLSATAAAFQERSMNLQHEVQKLQSEIRLLAAPAMPSKPWWKFWG